MNNWGSNGTAMTLDTGIMPVKVPVRRRNKKICINNYTYDRPVILFAAAFTALTVVSFFILDIDWIKLFSRADGLAAVFVDLAHLNFDKFDITFNAFLETVSVTILATIYSTVLGVFLGALGARNITPWKGLAKAISAFLSLLRAVPTQVWVLLVLVCLGFGPAPGIVGLSFHITAFLGRAFAQAFEEVDEGTIEALRATGANRFQIFFGAVLPASFTRMIAWSAMRFEITFSEATILGMVGAGGIGYTVMAAMNSYNFGRAGVAILLVLLFAYGLEMSMAKIKRAVKV